MVCLIWIQTILKNVNFEKNKLRQIILRKKQHAKTGLYNSCSNVKLVSVAERVGLSPTDSKDS